MLISLYLFSLFYCDFLSNSSVLCVFFRDWKAWQSAVRAPSVCSENHSRNWRLSQCQRTSRSSEATPSFLLPLRNMWELTLLCSQAVPQSIDKHRRLMANVLADQRLTELQQRGGAWLAGLTNCSSGLGQKSPDCRYQNYHVCANPETVVGMHQSHSSNALKKLKLHTIAVKQLMIPKDPMKVHGGVWLPWFPPPAAPHTNTASSEEPHLFVFHKPLCRHVLFTHSRQEQHI